VAGVVHIGQWVVTGVSVAVQELRIQDSERVGRLGLTRQACPLELVPLFQDLGIGVGDSQGQIWCRILAIRLHQRIRLQEAAQGRVIKARPVIIQAQIRLPPLAGEAAIGGEEAGLKPDGAIGEIAGHARRAPALGQAP